MAYLAVTFVLTPGVMRFARHIDAVDRGGYRKVFEGAMPLLGGLGIAIPFILGALACGVGGYLVIGNWQWVQANYREHFDVLLTLAGGRQDLITIAIGGVGIIAIGLVDDTRGLRPKWKLLAQVGVALFVCFAGHVFTKLTIPFLGVVDFGVMGGRLLTMLWIVGLINAFNLVDGIDGLASGIAFIASMALLALSIIQGNIFVAMVSAALAGSLLGFLYFNFPPARIFLGDTGSMFIGYALATASLMGAQKSETAAILFAPMLALGLPVFETFISIVRRYINGVPVFTGDNRHTHHRLLLKGLTQRAAVLTLCGAEFLLAGAAVMSALIPDTSPFVWTPYFIYFATLGALLWMAEYGRPEALKTIAERRQRNRIHQTFGRYAAMRLNEGPRHIDRNLLLELCRQELGLRYLEAVFPDETRWCVSIHAATPASRERLRVKSSDDEDIIIWYAFLGEASANQRQDVSSCLATIFDGLNLSVETPAPATPDADGTADAPSVPYSAKGKLGLHDHP
jgi:UDP-GlcNAc:undecaprenyl-phosphate GlcNAc-1-phosphate transferase